MGDPRDDIAPDRRAGTAPQTGPTENVAGITDPIVVELVKDLLAKLKFSSAPKIYTLQTLEGLSEPALADLIPDYTARQQVLQAIQDQDKFRGRTISPPNGSPIVIIKESSNQLAERFDHVARTWSCSV